MSNAAHFWATIASPTLAEFSANPADVRRAVLASVVVHHASEHAFVDRKGAEDAGEAQVRYWQQQSSPAFRIVAAAATAAKHGTRRRDAYSFAEIHRKPPAVAGEAECGLSELGDTVGSVMAQSDVGASDLIDLHQALEAVVAQLSADFPELSIDLP